LTFSTPGGRNSANQVLCGAWDPGFNQQASRGLANPVRYQLPHHLLL